MSILTTKRTWKRKRTPELEQFFALRKLTPRQRANVCRVLDHLAIELGGLRKLASVMGMTMEALTKARQPCRPVQPRLAMMAARIAGVGVDDVLAGRWKRHACTECGCVEAV